MSKQERQKFGKLGGPITADRAFVKDMPFDHDGTHTQSWILVNGNQRTHVNSYDGNLGRKITSLKWYEFDPEDKKMQKKLKEYEEVSISECPFAIPGEGADVEDEELTNA